MSDKITEIEEREGKSIEQILTDLFNEHNSQREVAKQLGINQSTVSYWLVKLGLRQKTILVPIETKGRE
jgi:predicted transcriptional regulator